MKQDLNKEFWTQRYNEGTIGWDVGKASTPITTFIDQLANKELKILIPGAGNAYEAEYLWKKGFNDVYVLDISPVPLDNFKKRNPEFPEHQLLLMDFFELKNNFDLVIEQTFFCAIPRNLRPDYAKKMHEVIKPGGKLAGVLFGIEFEKEGPPFGGTKEEYIKYFEPYFDIKVYEEAYNSIKPRAGRELFINFVRK